MGEIGVAAAALTVRVEVGVQELEPEQAAHHDVTGLVERNRHRLNPTLKW